MKLRSTEAGTSQDLLAHLEAPLGVPLWEIPRPPGPLPPLGDDVEADLVVVGAGFTGLATAREAALRRPDWTVVVLEASHAGAWASGRTGGIVLAGTATEEEPGTMDAPDALAAMVREEGIACNLRLQGCYEVSRDSRAPVVGPIDWGDSGRLRPVDLVPGGDVHPGRLVGGLLQAALRRGARVAEASRVAGLVPPPSARGPVIVRVERRPDAASEYEVGSLSPSPGPSLTRGEGSTRPSSPPSPTRGERASTAASGRTADPAAVHVVEVRARHVVLATEGHGVPLPPEWQGVRGEVHATDTFAIATRPVAREVLTAAGWADERPFYTVDFPYLWGRTTVDGRIVVGSYLASRPGPGAGASEGPARCRALARRLRGLHPAFAHVRISHGWWGPVAARVSWEPIFRPLDHDRRVWCIGAFGGHGVALGPLLGRRLAAYLAGDTAALRDLSWATGF